VTTLLAASQPGCQVTDVWAGVSVRVGEHIQLLKIAAWLPNTIRAHISGCQTPGLTRSSPPPHLLNQRGVNSGLNSRFGVLRCGLRFVHHVQRRGPLRAGTVNDSLPLHFGELFLGGV
jgi:hypothetical protein